MKVFFNKIKKSNKVLLTLFIISFLSYFVGVIFFIKGLLALKGIETVLRIIFIILFIIWLLVYFLWNLINLILKRNKTIIITSIITILFAVIFIGGSLVINTIYSSISGITSSEYTLYTTNLIAMNETKLTNDSKIGMISNKDDIEGNTLAKELIKNKKLKNEVVLYDDYYVMLNDLYDNNIDAIFVSSNYKILFSTEEKYENIATETYVIYEYSKKLKTENNLAISNKKLTEPFTVLIMGVDSEKDGLNANAAFNGDTLMLITFNPKTLTATMFSIPRDTYVPIACNNNAYSKINFSAAYGTNCVIDTVKKLVDIDIDYYAKINFKGVVDLVEALNGVDIDVPMEFCEQDSNRSFAKEDIICLSPGYQKLNGEQTLAFARHRKTLIRGDIDRTQNQQLVIEAIAKKMINQKTLNSFEKILNAVSNNISTNMSTEQILSFYDILKNMVSTSLKGNDFITIHKTYLEYYSLPVYLTGSNMYTSAIGHYPGSLDEIKKLMKVNLGLEEKEIIKTFSYTYNENYEAGLTGKNITTGAKLQLVPDFTGTSVEQVRSWGSSNNVSVNVNGSGTYVTSQSIHVGVLAKSISSITVQSNEQVANYEE